MTSPAHPTTAHYFWEGLTDLGMEYVFGNLGTDHVSLIEELARWDREGRPHPQMVLCPHENVAMHMAAGYAAVTGKGQAVMVHVDAGTANAAMGMHNMFRARLPVMLIAGKAPFTLRGELPGSRDNYVHFVQDPFDIASLVRPYVKWEYSLPSGVMAQEALRRGHAMMESDPPGPVYLTLPREVLAETWPPEKAKALLKEAGVQTPLNVTLTLPPPPYARKGGEILAAQLAKVGIVAKIENVEWAQWLGGTFKGNFDLTVINHVEPLDYMNYANPAYYWGYDSKAFRDLAAKHSEASGKERTKLFGDMQRLIANDAVNVFLFNASNTAVYRKGLKGLWSSSPIFANDMSAVSWQ